MPVTIELNETPYGPLWKVITDDGRVEWYSKRLLARQAAARHANKAVRESIRAKEQ